MSRYTGADVIAAATAAGADAALARIMAAAALSEGMGNTEAVGDNGASWGPYQIYLSVHGLSREQACDLDFATRWMYDHEFAPAYRDGQARGYDGEQLARWTAMAAERPYGWNGPSDPGLDSPAADNYAAHWRELGDAPMPDLRQAFLTEIRQHFGTPYVFGAKGPTNFDCSGLLTWCARQVGLDLGDPLMTSADGLKGYCDPISVNEAQPGDLYLFSETYGDGGPDYATHCGAALGDGRHMLDDHGDPWPGCGQTDISTSYWQEHLIGAFRPRGYADVGEDSAMIAELQQQLADAQNLLGNIQGDWANAVEAAIRDAKQESKKARRDADLDAALAALNTIRTGGA